MQDIFKGQANRAVAGAVRPHEVFRADVHGTCVSTYPNRLAENNPNWTFQGLVAGMVEPRGIEPQLL